LFRSTQESGFSRKKERKEEENKKKNEKKEYKALYVTDTVDAGE